MKSAIQIQPTRREVNRGPSFLPSTETAARSGKITRDFIDLSPAPLRPELSPFLHIPNDQLESLRAGVAAELHRRKVQAEERDKLGLFLRKSAKKSPSTYLQSADPAVPLAINPDHFRLHPTDRSKCLAPLLKQDWSSLWGELDNSRRFYVYAHVDPNHPIFQAAGYSIRLPFYIGKGCGDRAYNLSRNQGHGIRLKHLMSAGATKDQLVRMIKTNLTEQEAFELEAKLVYFFGRVYDDHSTGVLLNLDPCPRPVFQGVMPSFSMAKLGK